MKAYILGSGLAGKAIAEALAILNIIDQDVQFESWEFLDRGTTLSSLRPDENAVLFLANPSALHTSKMVEAENAGFRLIVCEKPTSINQMQLIQAKQIKAKVAVLHVYRQLWGPQKLRQLITQGEFGNIVAIEGKLWQSSKVGGFTLGTAAPPTPRSWSSDPELIGYYGVSLGLGTHWLDLAHFLIGQELDLNHFSVQDLHGGENREDTYVNIQLTTRDGTYISGSISNMVHGAANDLSIHILGEKAAASWNFLDPDEIIWGKGKGRSVLFRDERHSGSGHPPFHGLGWIEGYIEIIRQICRHHKGLDYLPYPTLQESCVIIEKLLTVRPELQILEAI